MIDVAFQRGVFLPTQKLWLDPWEPQSFAFVSHAHSDHTGRHARTICTPATSRLMRARIGPAQGEEILLRYREPREIEGSLVELYPAGHVLGSAQIHLQTQASSLLYTGDFKIREGFSSEKAEFPRAETLVMETTYGRPHYRFPPTQEVLSRVTKFCRESLEEGETPVLLGYSLGKAQEILAALSQAGLSIVLHRSIFELARVYEDLGVRFPEYAVLAPENATGKVLLCPPSAAGSVALRKVPKKRVAVLTGWALDPGAIYRYQVDEAFPLSDHADYDDLLRCVEAVQPQRILTLHGFAKDFARDLRALGWEAWSLGEHDQLELFSGCYTPAVAALGIPADEAQLERSEFGRFCLLCLRIREATGRLQKIALLQTFLRTVSADDVHLVCAWLGGNPLPRSAEGKPMQVGGAILKRVVTAASGLSEGVVRATWRRHNDSGAAAKECMAARGKLAGLKASFREMAARFAALRSAKGLTAKAELLRSLFEKATPNEAEFVTRILTGDLRIGLKEGLLEEAAAAAFLVTPEAMREATQLTGDAGVSAAMAAKGKLHDVEMEPFRPVKVMLAGSEPDAETLWQRIVELGGAEDGAWMEDKLDGIRLQLHRTGTRVAMYTRDLKDTTRAFPEIEEAALRLQRDVVLDGEILAFDQGRPLPFADLQRRLGRKDRDLFLANEVPLAYAVFDILWIEGRSLLRLPLRERRSVLDSLELPESFFPLPVSVAASADELGFEFLAARARGAEGLVVKNPGSRYTPGRRGLSWIKLKGAAITLDVVVTGVEYGHGKRNRVLSDYTFSVLDPETGAYLPIGKAYSGLTDAEIEELTAEFLTLARAQKGRVMQVEPKVVLEVAFDSIRESDRHASGLALRFPRIKRIRRDKGPSEVDTLQTARRLIG